MIRARLARGADNGVGGSRRLLVSGRFHQPRYDGGGLWRPRSARSTICDIALESRALTTAWHLAPG